MEPLDDNTLNSADLYRSHSFEAEHIDLPAAWLVPPGAPVEPIITILIDSSLHAPLSLAASSAAAAADAVEVAEAANIADLLLETLLFLRNITHLSLGLSANSLIELLNLHEHWLHARQCDDDFVAG